MLTLLSIACRTAAPPPPATPPPQPAEADVRQAAPPGPQGPGPSSPAPAHAVPAPAALGLPPPTADTILAVGDLHADLDNAEATLRLLGVTDEDGHWAAGPATFVQTGDTTDRGPDSAAIMAMIRRLEGEAAAAGGRVVPLLGNHEVMNLQGDLRYVHPGDIAAYGGPAERRAALGPTGEDGRWLRTLDAAAKVGDTVFVHGGLHPDVAALGIEDVNELVRAGIDTSSGPPLGTDGPL